MLFKQDWSSQFICILLLITELNKTLVQHQTVKLFHSQVVVAGTFHQGQTDQFSDQSVGRQCISNSVAVIAFSKAQTYNQVDKPSSG